MVTAILQWGHGGDAVEIGGVHPGHITRAVLQWGHGGDAVEMRERLSVPASTWALQWGHGGDAVEISYHFAGRDIPGLTSMGPRR